MSEKIVLTEQEADIVEEAKTREYPAYYIGEETDSIPAGLELKLMKALVLGYETIKSKYIVYQNLPGVLERGSKDVIQARRSQFQGNSIIWEFTVKTDMENESDYLFTNDEIKELGLEDCERKEVK